MKKGKRQLAVVIDEVVFQDIERISLKLRISKSRVARNLLYAGLDEVRVLKSFVQATPIFRGFSKLVKEKDFWSTEAGFLLNDEDGKTPDTKHSERLERAGGTSPQQP